MAITFYIMLVDRRRQRHHRHPLRRVDQRDDPRAARSRCSSLPPIAYVITKRICLGLQRRDRERLLHGRETGVIRRLPSGEFIEVHAPISDEERVTLLQSGSKKEPVFEVPPAIDENGVPAPGSRLHPIRARLSRWYYSETIPDPTPEELHDAAHHAQELAEHQQRQLDSGHS